MGVGSIERDQDLGLGVWDHRGFGQVRVQDFQQIPESRIYPFKLRSRVLRSGLLGDSKG